MSNHKPRRWGQQDGATLVELMAALAVVSIIGMVTLSLIGLINKTSRQLQRRSDQANALVRAANRIVVDAQQAVRATCTGSDTLKLASSADPTLDSYVLFQLNQAPDGRMQLHRRQVQKGVEQRHDIVGRDLAPSNSSSGTVFTCMADRLVAVQLAVQPSAGAAEAIAYTVQAHLRSD